MFTFRLWPLQLAREVMLQSPMVTARLTTAGYAFFGRNQETAPGRHGLSVRSHDRVTSDDITMIYLLGAGGSFRCQ